MKVKSLSNPTIKLNKHPLIKLEKINKNHNSIQLEISTPKLPKINQFFPEISKSPINQNHSNFRNSAIQSSEDTKTFKSLFNSAEKSKDISSFRNIKIKQYKKLISMPILIKSPSELSMIPKKIPNIRDFHHKIMDNNRLSYGKIINAEYSKFESDNNYDIDEMLIGFNDKNKKIKTGIYGPNDNIVSVIRAKMERLKYDNEYRGVDPELKELIKDEILDAQVKLKRKPDELNKKKFTVRPLYLRKLDQYRYLSKMNKIREINQMSSTPVIVKDGQVMLKLIDDAFNNFNYNKKN